MLSSWRHSTSKGEMCHFYIQIKINEEVKHVIILEVFHLKGFSLNIAEMENREHVSVNHTTWT